MSIYNLIRGWFTSGPYNLLLSRKLLSVTDTSNGNTWEDEPIVSIRENGDKKQITGIGADAKLTGDKIINPFDHPRLLISDFMAAEILLQYVIKSVAKTKWWAPSPIVIMQVKEKLEGGMSDIELRALRELAIGAGARQVYVLSSRELSNVEIKIVFIKTKLNKALKNDAAKKRGAF